MLVSKSFTLLNCQIFVLAQEHVACFSEWIVGFESVLNFVEPIGSMGLDGMNNKFTIPGKLSFESLAIYRSADECWTELDIKIDSHPQGIVPYKGKFYAIDDRSHWENDSGRTNNTRSEHVSAVKAM